MCAAFLYVLVRTNEAQWQRYQFQRLAKELMCVRDSHELVQQLLQASYLCRCLVGCHAYSMSSIQKPMPCNKLRSCLSTCMQAGLRTLPKKFNLYALVFFIFALKPVCKPLADCLCMSNVNMARTDFSEKRRFPLARI